VGTVGVVFEETGTAAETVVRDAWGNRVAGGTSERYGYAQREEDGESGLVYMRARMYDPRVGRFTQTDPLVWNRPFKHYAYGANNPLSHIDPLGLQEIPTLEEARRQEIEFLERRLKEEVTGFWNIVRSLDPFGGGLSNWSEFQARRLKLKGQAGEFLKRTGGEAGIWMHTITAVSPQQVASRIVAGKDLVTQTEVGANERAMEALLVLTPLALGRAVRLAEAAEVRAVPASTAAVAEETARVGIRGRAGISAGSEATTVLYRAVERAEFDDILTRGAFHNPPKTGGIKYFSDSLEGATSYAKQASEGAGWGPFWIVETRIRRDLITPSMRSSVDGGVPAIVVPTEMLPHLSAPEPLIQAPIKFPQR
jgi:RHS repeat-associated protein